MTTEQFYIDWKAGLDEYLAGYILDERKKQLHTRYPYLTIEYYLSRLLDGTLQESEKIVILPGIRGVGKTTLLAQLYFFERFLNPKRNKVLERNKTKLAHRMYVSADRLAGNGISLNDFFDFYEKNVTGSFANIQDKALILIDEIQYDEHWSLFLKLLFDKTKGHKNVLVVVTGSAALLLNKKNQDLVRRSIVKKVFPAKFSEYILLHQRIFPKKGLGSNIKDALFHSNSAQEVYDAFSLLEPAIIEQLSSISGPDKAKTDYMLRGSFPFSMGIENTVAALERIREMVHANIIQRDLILLGDFEAETLVKIPDALFLLANSDQISTKTLSDTLGINSQTLQKVLAALIATETLFEVLPYGQPHKQVKKTSKYLFVTPNIRAALLRGIIQSGLKGKLLEDYCALVFAKDLSDEAQFYYDYAKGGADFIIRFRNNSEVVVEVGFQKNHTRQVQRTIEKTNGRARYGLVIGSKKLELRDNVVCVPLNYFLLL